MKSFQSLRIGALAMALVIAASTLHAADTIKPAGTSLANLSHAKYTNTLGYDSFIVRYKDGSSEQASGDAAVQNIKAAVSRAGLDGASKSSAGATIAPLSVTYKRRLATGSQLIATSRKLSPSEAKSLMAQIAADPAVVHVQPNYRRYAVKDIQVTSSRKSLAQAAQPKAFTPNDPGYTQLQWDFFDPTGGASINNAWDLADGAGVTVAVLDTGITDHPDLDTSLADEGYDFISSAIRSGRNTDGRVPGGWDTGDWDNTEPYLQACHPSQPEGSSWHGSHVSGTIAAMTNNGQGIAGTAYNAKLLPVRVLGHCGGDDADIADAIEWASGGHVQDVPDNTHVAQVINMSLGGPNEVDDFGNVLPVTCDANSEMAVAISHAISRGTTVVVAAGNEADDARYYSPGGCPGVVAVASNGVAGKRAFYSNYGSAITLSAPGGGLCPDDAAPVETTPDGRPACPGGLDPDNYDDGWVWSTVNTGATTPEQPAYNGFIGTSQATPHVAGTVALMLSAAQQAGLPQPTPAQVKNILADSARAFSAPTDHPVGAGIVDAYAAINMAVNGDDDGGDPGNPGDGGTTAKPLTKGVLLPGQSATADSILYAISVPAGAATLNLRTLGGAGNVALYVKAGSAPAMDGSNADFRSAKPGTSQAVVIQVPQAVTYYLRVAPQQGGSFSNISVLADYSL